MRVLLVQSYLGRKERPILPLGLAYLASHLEGHEVSVLDPNIAENPWDSLKKGVVNFKPQAIGISLRNIDTTQYKDIFYYYKTLSVTVELIRETAPHSCLIIGGSAFSLYSEEIMRQNPEIDFGIYLDGEKALPELLDNLSSPSRVKGIYYRENGKLAFSGLRPLYDFDRSVAPKRDSFELDKYDHPEGIGIQSKRGCSLNCAYCTYPFLTGHSLRLRHPRTVVDEIEQLVNKSGVRFFMFADTVFNLPKWHAQQICEELIQRGIKGQWAAYFSLKEIDKDFITLAHRAGCYRFLFSPDGYSNQSLRLLRKEVDKNEVEKVYRLVKTLKLEGAAFDFSYFLNAPGQDYLSFLALMGLLFKTNYLLPRRRFMTVSVNVARIEPHTELHKLAIKGGTLSGETQLLPSNENLLRLLYYHNPKMRLAETIYKSMLTLKKILKTL
jgi:anaerobic magnesium-protoporphyrin IX monomethyl ester cyclase